MVLLSLNLWKPGRSRLCVQETKSCHGDAAAKGRLSWTIAHLQRRQLVGGAAVLCQAVDLLRELAEDRARQVQEAVHLRWTTKNVQDVECFAHPLQETRALQQAS